MSGYLAAVKDLVKKERTEFLVVTFFKIYVWAY